MGAGVLTGGCTQLTGHGAGEESPACACCRLRSDSLRGDKAATKRAMRWLSVWCVTRKRRVLSGWCANTCCVGNVYCFSLFSGKTQD